MALGALTYSRAQVALAVSGIAGPSGGSEDKPVGSVWFAWALPEDTPGPAGETAGVQLHTQLLCFAGDREEVRHQAVRVALGRLLELLPAPSPDD